MLWEDPASESGSWLTPEEDLLEMARWQALNIAREGYQKSGRGASVVPWPPEERLAVSFLREVDCVALGAEVGQRVASYNPRHEFVLIFLHTDGGTDVYTYRIPEPERMPRAPMVN